MYREKIEQLTAAFEDEALKAQAFERLRALIEAVVLTPEDGDLTIDLRSELASMLSLCVGLAISGATRNRPGLHALLERVGEFDVVVAESLDRLSRDQEDIAGIYKRLRFAGTRIVTLSEGDVSELHIGLKGTMGALFLKELGEKTRRGQIGRVAKGRIPGGISYGYRRVAKLAADGEPERGLREIDEAQAEVVRRIFREYLAGRSARAIAQSLNHDGIPSPSGKEWRANTINGNRERGNGILHNELYAGVISYNRQSFVRDPMTRKRVARPNPREQWVTTAYPSWPSSTSRAGRRPRHGSATRSACDRNARGAPNAC